MSLVQAESEISATPRPHGSRPLIGLDLLRFGAACLVVLYHLACTAWMVPSSEAATLIGQPIPFPALLPVSSEGWVGVPMFFVISGYVIAYSASHASALRFLTGRILRLVPGIWFCATVSFGLALLFDPEAVRVLFERYVRTLVLFPVPRWIDGVYWTLGIEIMFYGLVYALLFLNRFERVEPVILAVGVISAGAWLLAATPLWPDLGRIISTRIAKLALLTHGCHFAVGVLVWSAVRSGLTAPRLAGLAVCLAGSFLQIRYDAGFVGASLGLDRSPTTPWLLFAVFMVLFCLSIRANTALTDAFPGLGRRFRDLGLATYPLYLLHTFVGALAMRFLAAYGLPPAASLTGGIGVAVAASLLVSQRIEPPLRASLGRVLHIAGAPLRRRGPAPGALPR
ncbi:acyltransferase [Methylorubrum sp. Q1]|uniref:acyltransferase family protein n=1 Tax=Methylorubrum sp. Q1 TaxID=2562453 RepID=UPI001075D6E6|nr:acyltransferase [Methylorubrum sp. Q1]TFZ55159.1 acyltransferase [Methylorubrum sp. Q1]